MHNEFQPTAGGQTRRDFLRKTATAAAVVAGANVLKPELYAQAPSAGRVIGANDRIVVGFIGVGGQGMAHVRDIKAHAAENNVALAAVCDVWTKRIESAKAFIGGDCQGYDDHRKLLERKDIDAVVVSTVDHWHTQCSVDAMEAGKHVYVEKPMTRYLDEAFRIWDTCKKTGKVLQVGSQGCSDLKWHKAAEWVKAGRVGPIVMIQGSYMRNNRKGEWNYTIDPDLKADTVNWDRWLGPVRKRVSVNPDHFFRWRKYYPYCAGLLGDLFPHKLHPYMLATGNPEFPKRVAAVGSKAFHTDRNTPGTPERDVPEIVQMIAEFPSGAVMHITSSTVNETGTQELIRGHKGNLYMGTNRVELKPEKQFADEVEPEESEQFRGETLAAHQKNWFDAIRGVAKANCGIELAVRVQTIISLAEMSERLNVMCLFDEKTRKITTGDGRELKPISYGWAELS